MLAARDAAGATVYGWDASRDRRYACPECLAPVVLKQGPILVDHFAHRPDESCGYGEGESYQHMYMKQQLLRLWPDAELEVPLFPRRRADCVLRDPGGRPLVIECQASEISVDEYRERSADYLRNNIALLWIWYSELFSEHNPPVEYRIRAAALEDAERRRGYVVVFRWPGRLESWRLVEPYRGTVYVRRVYRRLIALEGERIGPPRPWVVNGARTLWLPAGEAPAQAQPASGPQPPWEWTPERIAEIAQRLEGSMWYGKPEPDYEDRPSSDPAWEIPRGTRVCIGTAELPAMPWSHTPARTCWRLQDVDGQPLYVGLFVGPDQAREYARAHGWQVVDRVPARPEGETT